MDFEKQKAIFIQIADNLSERILAGEWKEESRIPSVRDTAGLLGVNPNTVMRAYDLLQQQGIIVNQRGIGYFVSPDAKKTIARSQREIFINEEWPAIKAKIEMLGLSLDDLLGN